ncbi:MAG: hypothetical protein RL235_1140 [Chlamydiota bacterium]|jgi:LysM repeat protein
MDRKKTILIAVSINAALLGTLAIAALTSQEEEASISSVAKEQPIPLFPESADMALQKQHEAPKIAPPPSLVETPVALPLPAVVEEPVVHKLPPVAPIETPSKQQETSLMDVSVKKGDSLEKIARAHHTTIDEIIRLNHLPSSFLKVGQVLKVVPGKQVTGKAVKPAAAPAVAAAEYYVVKVGDSPWSIAMKHHIKVEELLRLNQLNEEKARKLKPGDRLRVR